MLHLPSDEYIEFIKKMVEFFDRKEQKDTCFHSELAEIRRAQKEAKHKVSQKEITDGE